MKQLNEFVRQYVLLIVLLILMITQIFTWRTLVMVRENTGDTCGRSEHPCYVVVIPNAR